MFNKINTILLLFSICFLSCKEAKKEASTEKAKPKVSLKNTFKDDFLIGAALNTGQYKEQDSVQKILIEKESKKSDAEWCGRNSQNTVAVFPKEHYKVGDFVMVKINSCTKSTLIGEAVGYSPQPSKGEHSYIAENKTVQNL